MAFLIVVPAGKTIEISGPLQLSVKGDVVPTIAPRAAKEQSR